MLFVELITYRLVKVCLQGCGSCGRGAVEGRVGHSFLHVLLLCSSVLACHTLLTESSPSIEFWPQTGFCATQLQLTALKLCRLMKKSFLEKEASASGCGYTTPFLAMLGAI